MKTKTKMQTATPNDSSDFWLLKQELGEALRLSEATIDYTTYEWTRTELDHEKIVRSVAFILNWLTFEFNESIDGVTAGGLSKVLARCAANMQAARKEANARRAQAASEALEKLTREEC